MQLPWPFRRSQRSPSSDGDVASDRAASAEAGAGPTRAEARGDWRRLPPLSETIGPPPLMAPPRPFAGALAASNPPPPILAPLAHGRSIEAPSGLVVGVARPIAALGGPAIPMPAQRSPLGAFRRSADAAVGAESSAVDALTEEVAGRSAAAGPAESSGPAVSPIDRRLEVTSTTALVRTSMTQAPDPSRRMPVVGLVGQPRAPGASLTATVPATPAASAGPTVQRSPITPPSSSLPAAAALTPGDSLPVAPRLTIGQSRRLGLGAPIAAVPFGGAQLPAAPSSPAMGSLAGAATRSPLPTSPSVDPYGGSPDAAALPLATERPASPPPEDVRTPSPSPAPSAARPAPAAASSVVTVRPSALTRVAAPTAGRPAARSSPIVSARSLGAGVQRAPLTLPLPQAHPGGPGSATPRPSPPAQSQPVRVHRGSDAADLATALDARSFTHGGEIFMPASVGPLSSGKGQALLAHEMIHVAQQRRLAGSLPGEDSAHGRTLEAEAVAAERAPDLTLAPRSSSQPRSEESPGPDTGVPATGAGPELTGPRAQPQRAPNGASGGGTQRPSRGSKGHTHTEQELEVLAHQLYHRIGRHLRRELLVDRERAGLALDLP